MVPTAVSLLLTASDALYAGEYKPGRLSLPSRHGFYVASWTENDVYEVSRVSMRRGSSKPAKTRTFCTTKSSGDILGYAQVGYTLLG
jgi:hypothetical protein